MWVNRIHVTTNKQASFMTKKKPFSEPFFIFDLDQQASFELKKGAIANITFKIKNKKEREYCWLHEPK